MNPSTPSDLERLRHDLMTPLSTVIGFGMLLERTAPESMSPEQALYVRNLNRGAQQLLALIEQIGDPGDPNPSQQTP
jgi:signal transduction histidine kinase